MPPPELLPEPSPSSSDVSTYPSGPPARVHAGLRPVRGVTTARICGLLRASHFLRGLPPQAQGAVEQLAVNARLRELRAGEHVWREGDVATAFHVIGHGLITVQRLLPSGSEVIVGIFGARESVGDTAVIEGARYPAAAVVTSEAAEVVRLEASEVQRCAALYPALAGALQQALCRHAAVLRTKVEILAAGSVRARLAKLFLHLAARFGEELEDGTVVVPVALSRTTLASLVSARSETVIRALRPWEQSGVVVTRAGAFHLSGTSALAACAAEG